MDKEKIVLNDVFRNTKVNSFNKQTGINTLLSFENGELTINKKQDVTAALKRNRELYNADDGYSPSRDVRRVAHLPNAVYWDLKRRGILDDEKEFDKWLNDPDNRAFRTAEGNI